MENFPKHQVLVPFLMAVLPQSSSFFLHFIINRKKTSYNFITLLGNLLASKYPMSFILAALTNSHKLDGLKQHSFILLHFWRSWVWNQCHWGKIKVLTGLSSLYRLCGGTLLLSLSCCQVCMPCIVWHRATSYIFKGSRIASSKFFQFSSHQSSFSYVWSLFASLF